MATAAISIIGLGLKVVGALGSRSAAKKERREREEQNRQAEIRRQEEEKRAKLQRRRERFRLLEQARRQRAAVTASAVRSGGLARLGSSGVAGAQNIVSQRLGRALGTQTALTDSGENISRANAAFAAAGGRAAEARNRGSLFSGISQLGGTLQGVANSPALQTIFS